MNTSARPIIAVIGANGRTGRALCRALLNARHPLIACTRTPDTTHHMLAGTTASIRQIDLNAPNSLVDALKGASYVINTAHARHLPALLHATHAPILALGSTRKNSRWPDDHARGVLSGERALQADARPSIILHPTMIYGAEGENNVQRLVQLLRYLPVIPLPSGGQALVQPIEQNDVIRCLLAALERLMAGTIQEAESITIAGPTPLSYRDFITTLIAQSGLHRRPIITMPAGLLMLAAQLTPYIPGLPTISRHEVRRLLEDKHANITMMMEKLDVQPVDFNEGIRRLFHRS